MKQVTASMEHEGGPGAPGRPAPAWEREARPNRTGTERYFALQRTLGNRAVAHIVRPGPVRVQRQDAGAALLERPADAGVPDAGVPDAGVATADAATAPAADATAESAPRQRAAGEEDGGATPYIVTPEDAATINGMLCAPLPVPEDGGEVEPPPSIAALPEAQGMVSTETPVTQRYETPYTVGLRKVLDGTRSFMSGWQPDDIFNITFPILGHIHAFKRPKVNGYLRIPEKLLAALAKVLPARVVNFFRKIYFAYKFGLHWSVILYPPFHRFLQPNLIAFNSGLFITYIAKIMEESIATARFNMDAPSMGALKDQLGWKGVRNKESWKNLVNPKTWANPRKFGKIFKDMVKNPSFGVGGAVETMMPGNWSSAQFELRFLYPNVASRFKALPGLAKAAIIAPAGLKGVNHLRTWFPPGPHHPDPRTWDVSPYFKIGVGGQLTVTWHMDETPDEGPIDPVPVPNRAVANDTEPETAPEKTPEPQKPPVRDEDTVPDEVPPMPVPVPMLAFERFKRWATENPVEFWGLVALIAAAGITAVAVVAALAKVLAAIGVGAVAVAGLAALVLFAIKGLRRDGMAAPPESQGAADAVLTQLSDAPAASEEAPEGSPQPAPAG